MKAIEKTGIGLPLLIVLVQTDLNSQWKPTNIKISLMTESISLPFGFRKS